MVIGLQVTFDATDPRGLADFWALALSYEPQPPPEGFTSWEEFGESIGMPESEWDSMAAVIDPAGVGPRVLFQRVPEGKTVKNRVHLDVHASAGYGRTDEGWRRVEDHVRTLTDAGAVRVAEVHEPKGRCVVMRDPEGNEFCVQ